MLLDTGHSDWVWAVAFHPDGTHFLGGGREQGCRRWRLADGQEVGGPTEMTLQAISVSRNHRWVVCGTRNGASLWDEDLREKVVDVEGENEVWAVDVSPDSSRFATGTSSNASIWSIPSGERLVGPLEHGINWVAGVRFSPTGEHIATACIGDSVCVFDSQTGDKLVTISTTILRKVPVTPLVWSSDGRQIFVASDNKLRSFNIPVGSVLAESQMYHGGNFNDIHSIVLAPNDKFIATSADRSMFFLHTSTLTQVGPVIEEGERLASIAISADSRHLAIGRGDGKIIFRDLSKILPDSYGPFHVSICAFITSSCQVIPIPSHMAINLHR